MRLLSLARLCKAVLFSAAFAAAAHAAPTPGQYENSLSVNQEVIGIVPQMLDWWWDNIRTEERFQRWAPGEHLDFRLLEPPAAPNNLTYSVGTTQRITTYLGGFPVTTTVTWRSPDLWPVDNADAHTLVAELEFDGLTDISRPGNGWLIHEYAYNEDLDGVVMETTVLLPDVVEAAYPGYTVALEQHIRNKMQNLPDFLPELFRQEFVVAELESRGSFRVSWQGLWKKTIVVDQEIKGLMPEMVDWWWDNIDTTARYKLWHPVAHTSFEWVVPPAYADRLAYSPGAVQKVDESLGRYDAQLLITWLDPMLVEDRVEYDHWLYASTDLAVLKNILPQTLIHEYQANAAGDGILMRSTFTIPSFFDLLMPGFSRQLGKHALQEMQFLQYFLPEMFEREYLEPNN
ncbi:DAPG hydrolase family protein [Hydrocarboniclastica marina]|uniref:DAPG hydrolase PhiG domain-containing protein n=1 Tax=Hydrocarboniclastica marina TaxID=2259620 RepID=A0A4P7XEY7_9ALTE|nr:hypothetical protein [Hydrocarboniclastica marina]QCF25478.1 hypothetical protein soil367_05790 [Hydrocarboniclastica marina]